VSYLGGGVARWNADRDAAATFTRDAAEEVATAIGDVAVIDAEVAR
jgi:hypothetical protein